MKGSTFSFSLAFDAIGMISSNSTSRNDVLSSIAVFFSGLLTVKSKVLSQLLSGITIIMEDINN